MNSTSSQFNLIDEPWVPVRFLNGSRAELGIRDTLLRAKEIATIEDGSPLVVASLHRFLLAVLYRALEGPTDIEQAKAWFKAGLPADKICTYLGKWRDRFWLFDEKYPFFQVPDFEPKKWNAWTALAAEHNANNAKVLFDHIDVTQPGDIPCGLASKWLLAIQTFTLGGGNSEFQYTKGAPSTKSAMFIPFGKNLEDTFIFCLVPQNRAVITTDTPIWERVPESSERLKSGIRRGVAGFSDLYTWQTRSIRFLEDSPGQIAKVAFASGIENTTKDSIDPMLAYRIDKSKGRLPLQFKERGLWRDFDSLLPDNSHLAPHVIEHATALARFSRDRLPQSVFALGLANNPRIEAKIEYWRMERFALPQALLADRPIRTEIRNLLSDGEKSSNILKDACEYFAKQMLAHGNRNLQKGDIDQFVKQMSVSTSYWSRLEAAFHDTLRHYTLEHDPDDIRLDWLKAVRSALRDAWAQHAASVSTGDTWAIRALVRAEGAIGKQLKALNDEIQKYENHRKQREETA